MGPWGSGKNFTLLLNRLVNNNIAYVEINVDLLAHFAIGIITPSVAVRP